jgi:hypothetical protein
MEEMNSEKTHLNHLKSQLDFHHYKRGHLVCFHFPAYRHTLLKWKFRPSTLFSANFDQSALLLSPNWIL